MDDREHQPAGRHVRFPLMGLLCLAFLLLAGGYVLAHEETFNDNDNCGANTDGHDHRDVFHMQDGNDCASMKAGNDDVFGGNKGDNLDGGGGEDRVEGGDGGDFVTGGPANDRLRGEEGQDIVFGFDGGGGDVVDGGAGEDTCYADRAGDGGPIIDDVNNCDGNVITNPD